MTTERLRDTIYVIEADSSLIQALIACDSAGRAYLEEIVELQHGRVLPPAEVKIKDNVISVRSRLPAMNIRLQTKIVTTTTEKLVTNTQVVQQMNKWQTFWCRFGQIAAVAILLFMIFKYLFKNLFKT
jgi:hypothetical protein